MKEIHWVPGSLVWDLRHSSAISTVYEPQWLHVWWFLLPGLNAWLVSAMGPGSRWCGRPQITWLGYFTCLHGGASSVSTEGGAPLGRIDWLRSCKDRYSLVEKEYWTAGLDPPGIGSPLRPGKHIQEKGKNSRNNYLSQMMIANIWRKEEPEITHVSQ